MAKSPLMSLLRRAYGIARMSHRTGIPADELLGMARERASSPHRISRRRLLQAGLGAAGAIAASRFGRGNRAIARSDSPVLIVGAGIAGLTAAYRLAQAGVPVEIVEAQNRVGGRMLTLSKAAKTPLVAELGSEFINTDHTCVLNLAQELGLFLADLEAVDAGLIQDTYFFGGRSVPLEEIVRDFVPVAQQVEADLIAIENFEDYTTPDEATIAIDNISLADYLNQIPTTPTVRQLLKVAYTIEFGLNAEEQSPLNLIYFIGTEPGEFRVFGDSDERFSIDGGNQQLPQLLAQLLADSIRLGTVLEAIAESGSGFRVSLRSGNSSVERTYDRVVLAIPFSVLRTVSIDVELSPTKREAIEAVGYGTNSKIISAFEGQIWRDRYNSTGTVFSDLGFQNTWETSASRYFPGSEHLITNYTGGSQGVAIGAGTPEDWANKLRSQLDLVFPGIASRAIPDTAVRAFWTGNPFSRGSYLCYRPGQLTRFYGVEGERVGNLFFAGEHTSLEYQGFMEGGCETGELVALQILEDLGLSDFAQAARDRLRFNRSQRRSRSRMPGSRRRDRQLR